MHCEERIRELEEQLRELNDAWEADVERYKERISNLEDDCRELRLELDEWYDQAIEWKQRAHDYEDERNEALNRIRELEEELGCIKPRYEALLTIFQKELEHLETLITRADWEHAVEQIAHIKKRYHAAIAMHAFQNQNKT
jgi:chromosome segregation ATPase